MPPVRIYRKWEYRDYQFFTRWQKRFQRLADWCGRMASRKLERSKIPHEYKSTGK